MSGSSDTKEARRARMTHTDAKKAARNLQTTRCADPTHEPPREAKDGYLLESECITCTAWALQGAYEMGRISHLREEGQ